MSTDDELLTALLGLSEEDLADIVDGLPGAYVESLLADLAPTADEAAAHVPGSPAEMAATLLSDFKVRPHIAYLSERIRQALADVEAGEDRRLIVKMPPRMGKTLTATVITAAWVRALHPDWPIALISHSGILATSWGREIRRWAVEGKLGPAVHVSRDAGGASSWETTDRGRLVARSIREPLTGEGAKVMVIDDPHKDFADAHSKTMRDQVWQWWLSVGRLRLHPPSLVIVIMTRWHEDDLIGRLLDSNREGDPSEWEVISFPALAEGDDVLGRTVGEPLFSPLIEETRDEAIKRWEGVLRDVGTYVWTAMFQQRPSPAAGAIIDVSWWRYWTTDPSRVTDDGRVVLFDPSQPGKWLDSWDTAFTGTDQSDFVVGQRWCRQGANRFLVSQVRGRWTFTETLDALKKWARVDDPVASPYGHLVHQRLIESSANGPAIMDTLRDVVSGLKPVKAERSKEARARAVTPEIESGNVLLPLPEEQPWVTAYLSEMRNFPNDVNDDQVDATTQALAELRDVSAAGLSVPGRRGRPVGQRALTTQRTIPRRV